MSAQQATTIAAAAAANSSDIHHSQTTLQHPQSTVGSSRCPSNREGLEGTVSGAPDCSFLLFAVRLSFIPQRILIQRPDGLVIPSVRRRAKRGEGERNLLCPSS